MTIYQIKSNLENAPYFFDRKTLKCFGQTLKSFKAKNFQRRINKSDLYCFVLFRSNLIYDLRYSSSDSLIIHKRFPFILIQKIT
jgi:hypothetical protein